MNMISDEKNMIKCAGALQSMIINLYATLAFSCSQVFTGISMLERSLGMTFTGKVLPAENI